MPTSTSHSNSASGRLWTALLGGSLFGAGLWVGGMADPANVQGFLDVTGDWRPQLLGVLGGAVAVTTALYAWARRRGSTWWREPLRWPPATRLDAPLVLGAALFGVGWALAGYCPGPALVGLGSGSLDALAFVLAMWLGGVLQRRLSRGAA